MKNLINCFRCWCKCSEMYWSICWKQTFQRNWNSVFSKISEINCLQTFCIHFISQFWTKIGASLRIYWRKTRQLWRTGNTKIYLIHKSNYEGRSVSPYKMYQKALKILRGVYFSRMVPLNRLLSNFYPNPSRTLIFTIDQNKQVLWTQSNGEKRMPCSN